MAQPINQHQGDLTPNPSSTHFHQEPESPNNKSDLDSSKAIDNLKQIESDDQGRMDCSQREQDELRWALKTALQENDVLKERVRELQAKLAQYTMAIEEISQKSRQANVSLKCHEKQKVRRRRYTI